MFPTFSSFFNQEKTFKLTSKFKNMYICKYIYMFFLLNFSYLFDVGVDPPDMEALLGWRLRFFDGYPLHGDKSV